MRKRRFKRFLLACLILATVGIFSLTQRLRHRGPELLPLQSISWSWRDELETPCIVDLDDDGRDEIVFRDRNGWWWGEWEGKPPEFEKMPIPTEAKEVRVNKDLPSNLLIALPEQPPMPSTPLPKSEVFQNLWLVTQTQGRWRVVSRRFIALRFERSGQFLVPLYLDPYVAVLDWDKDRKANDVLMSVDKRTMEWWQRNEKGGLLLKARWKLPIWKLPIKMMDPLPTVLKLNLRMKSWTMADLDGDGQMDRIETHPRYEMFQGRPVRFIDAFLRIAISNDQEYSLKLPPYANSVLVSDSDGDGLAEIWWTTYDRKENFTINCWRFDPATRRFVTAFQTKVRRPEEGFDPYCLDVTFVNSVLPEWTFATDKNGQLFLFVLALKRGRKVIARWKLVNGEWQPVSDIPMPNQNGFELLWTGDGFLAFEERRRPLIASLSIALFDLVREQLFKKRPLYCYPAPSRLWAWQEETGWRVIDRLTAFGDEILGPYWTPCGDLDGDGQSEVLVWELNGRWLGQWRDGNWRKSRPSKSYEGAIGIMRDGQRRWLLCWDGKRRFTAVRMVR